MLRFLEVLGAPEIVQYLLEKKLINAEAIVDDDLTIDEVSRRNKNYRVIAKRGESYLLKQGLDAEGVATIAYEASVYDQLRKLPGYSSFEQFIPHFYFYDVAEHVIVLELFRDALNLREYQLSRGRRFSTVTAKRLGIALGTLHRCVTDESKECGQVFLRRKPWILSVHRPPLAILRSASSANVHLIRWVQCFPTFGSFLEGLRSSWKLETVVHGDIKFDNCILCSKPSPRNADLRLVDWEFAGIGDPCWDVGSVFASYLTYWLLSIPIAADLPVDELIALARFPLESMQPTMRAFWTSYVQKMELGINDSDEYLFRSVKYAAARIVQTAWEHMQQSVQLSANVACFLQVSLNVWERPHEAIVHLLGIEIP